jgi:AcrR family transcriptional regulator
MARAGTGARVRSAALEILLAEGAQAVTMRRVAADAGVSTMATYRHYPNREALLRAVVDDAFAGLGRDWGTAHTDGDFDSRLDALADDFLDFALGQPNLYAFLITDRREGARRFPEDFRDGGSPALGQVVAVVEQGIRDGVLRADDPLEVTLAITMPALGLVQLYLGGRINLSEEDFRALCKRTTARIIHGLRN